MLDLYHATRAELITIIREQRDDLADRDRRLAAQEQERAGVRCVVTQLIAEVGTLQDQPPRDDPPHGTPKGMPGLKSTDSPARAQAPRRKRATGAGRRRMEATARQVHALASWPECGAVPARGTVKRTREVIDLPPPVVVVTEHVYLERRCPDCGRRCVPRRS